MTERCGTPAYIAPEILDGKGYKGPPIDVWSSGVLLYALLYGRFPFDDNDLEPSILRGDYTLLGIVSPEAKDLLSRMLNLNPEARITIPEILLHPWMRSIDKSRIFNLP